MKKQLLCSMHLSPSLGYPSPSFDLQNAMMSAGDDALWSLEIYRHEPEPETRIDKAIKAVTNCPELDQPGQHQLTSVIDELVLAANALARGSEKSDLAALRGDKPEPAPAAESPTEARAEFYGEKRAIWEAFKAGIGRERAIRTLVDAVRATALEQYLETPALELPSLTQFDDWLRAIESGSVSAAGLIRQVWNLAKAGMVPYQVWADRVTDLEKRLYDAELAAKTAVSDALKQSNELEQLRGSVPGAPPTETQIEMFCNRLNKHVVSQGDSWSYYYTLSTGRREEYRRFCTEFWTLARRGMVEPKKIRLQEAWEMLTDGLTLSYSNDGVMDVRLNGLRGALSAVLQVVGVLDAKE